jgi:membrane protein DedA with SNARE-associated domain
MAALNACSPDNQLSVYTMSKPSPALGAMGDEVLFDCSVGPYVTGFVCLFIAGVYLNHALMDQSKLYTEITNSCVKMANSLYQNHDLLTSIVLQ